MKEDCIVLIGMPGVGKSTIGKILAQNLSYDFVDLDSYIEYSESTKIKDILRDKGEKYFMTLEAEKMSQIDLNKTVVAPGGSIVYNERLMSQIKDHATIVYLDDHIAKIRLRIKESNLDAIVWNENQSIISLYVERKPLYEKHAEITVLCANKSEIEIAKEVYSKFAMKNSPAKVKSVRS